MSEIIGLEAQFAPTPADERVGFAVTHHRPGVTIMFPIDETAEHEEPSEESSED